MRVLLAFIYLWSVLTVAPVSATEGPSIAIAPTESDPKSRHGKTCSPVKKPILYVIEKGDHLADIIRTFGFKPLYGKGTRVAQVSQMNEINDPNLIFPGQEIYLPFKCEEDTEKYVLIERELARQIDGKHLVKVKTRINKHGQRETVMRLPNGSSLAFKEEELPNPDQGNQSVQKIALSKPVAVISLDSASDKTPQKTRELASDVKSQEQVEAVSKPQEQMTPQQPTAPQTQTIPEEQKPSAVATMFSPYSAFSAGLLYGFYKIDSKEIDGSATASLSSKPSTGVALGWQLHWTPHLVTEFRFALRQIEMKRPLNGSLINERHTPSGMGMDLQYQFSKRFRSILGLNYEERLFVRSTQSGAALLEVYQQPSFDLKMEYEVVQSGALGFDFMFGYRKLPKTSTDSATMFDSGEYLMGAKIRQQLEKMQIELKLNYLKGQQKSSLSNQDNAAVEAHVGIKVEIGK